MTHHRLHPLALPLLLTAVAAPGCTIGAEEADTYRQAIPDKETVQIKLPGSTASSHQPMNADGTGTAQQALLGETARLYVVTRDVSRVVNAAAYLWLSAIDDVTKYPPSAIEGDVATWGPHTPALSMLTYRLDVKRVGEDQYEYVLVGKLKNQDDDGYLPMIEGESTVQDSESIEGMLLLNIENAHALDPTIPERGKIRFDYAVEGSEWVLDVQFDGFVSYHEEGPLDGTYHYREAADLSGDFAFLAASDIDENGSAAETWNIRSRWQPGGSGRSDVLIVGGDLGSIEVRASECWDDMFGRTYWTIDPAFLEPTEGSPERCVFEPANVEIDPGP